MRWIVVLLALWSTTALAAEPGQQVNVLLLEWKISTDREAISAGPVTFAVQNRGHDMHEMVIMKTDLPFDRLPQKKNQGIIESQAGVVIDEIEDIKPMSMRTLTVNLAPGRYVILCNMVEEEHGGMEEHYKLGMRTPLIVR